MWPTKSASGFVTGVERAVGRRDVGEDLGPQGRVGQRVGLQLHGDQAGGGQRNGEVRPVDLVAVGEHGDQVDARRAGRGRQSGRSWSPWATSGRRVGGAALIEVHGQSCGVGGWHWVSRRRGTRTEVVAGRVRIDDELVGVDRVAGETPAPPNARGSVRALTTSRVRVLVAAAAGGTGSETSTPTARVTEASTQRSRDAASAESPGAERMTACGRGCTTGRPFTLTERELNPRMCFTFSAVPGDAGWSATTSTLEAAKARKMTSLSSRRHRRRWLR